MFAMARLQVFQQKKDSCKFESQQARAIPRLIRRGLIAQEEIKARGGRPSPDRVDPIKPIFKLPERFVRIGHAMHCCNLSPLSRAYDGDYLSWPVLAASPNNAMIPPSPTESVTERQVCFRLSNQRSLPIPKMYPERFA
jgi:hypothetical protein